MESWNDIFEQQAKTDGANYHMLKEWLIKNFDPPKPNKNFKLKKSCK